MADVDERIERIGAESCYRWECCPTRWNAEHPDDPIIRSEWDEAQRRVEAALRNG